MLHVAEQVVVVPSLFRAMLPEPFKVSARLKFCTKLAVSPRAADIVVEHGAVPVHVPDQPAKVYPVGAVALAVTAVPLAKVALQVAVQVTGVPVPDSTTLPLPTIVRLRSNDCTNVAVTARAALVVVAQLPVPVQPPDQPVKIHPVSGVAVMVTAVPDG